MPKIDENLNKIKPEKTDELYEKEAGEVVWLIFGVIFVVPMFLFCFGFMLSPLYYFMKDIKCAETCTGAIVFDIFIFSLLLLFFLFRLLVHLIKNYYIKRDRTTETISV